MFRSPLVVALLFCLGAEAGAKEGFRQLTATFPAAVQAGTSATVSVRSNFTLDGAYEVFFDEPGIAMSLAETESIKAPLERRGAAGVPFRFNVNVPEGQKSRVYEYRIATPIGVSSVGHLMVTAYPVHVEATKDNGSLAAAEPVELPVTVCGVIDRNEDVDCYRFAGKQGQELTFEVFAHRVTEAIHDMVGKGYHMDAIITLYAPNGQVIAQNDNYIGGDSLIHCRLPFDGEYVLAIRDTRYVGDARFTYCIEMTDAPLVRATLPLAVQTGTTVDVDLIGYSLPEGARSPLSAADDEPAEIRLTAFETSRGTTRPAPVLVRPHPQIVAPADCTSLKSACPLELPVGVSAHLTRADEAHYYRFTATKGQTYRIEATSKRLGLPVDTLIEVLDAQGKKLAEADDMQRSTDSQLYFKAPADADYAILVRDLHAYGGEHYFYHLEVEPVGPDFEIMGEYYYAMLSPGTRVMWFVKLKRLHGFNEPVEIVVEGLPEGIRYVPVTIPAGMNHCGLILEAAPDAPVNASLAQLYGKATITDADGQPRELIRRGLVTAELQSQGGGQGKWPIRTQIVGVTEWSDLSEVTASPSEITLAPGEKAEITVRIQRHPEHTDPVILGMAMTYINSTLAEQLPPGVSLNKSSTTRLTGKALEGKLVLEAAADAMPVERFPIAALASVSISFSINIHYASNPITLTVTGKPAQ